MTNGPAFQTIVLPDWAFAPSMTLPAVVLPTVPALPTMPVLPAALDLNSPLFKGARQAAVAAAEFRRLHSLVHAQWEDDLRRLAACVAPPACVPPTWAPIMRRLADEAAAVAQAGRTFVRRAEAFEAFLVGLEWPMPRHLPLPTALAIAEHHAAGELSADDVADLFVEAYDADVLDEVFASWAAHPWLADRLPTLDEGLTCYRRGLYRAAVCTLLPQIEGVAADALGRKPNPQVDAVMLFGDGLLRRAARAYYAGPLHAPFRDRQAPAAPMSRHAVLHGAVTEGGTPALAPRALALRVVLMLDAVVDAADMYRRAGRGPSRGGPTRPSGPALTPPAGGP